MDLKDNPKILFNFDCVFLHQIRGQKLNFDYIFLSLYTLVEIIYWLIKKFANGLLDSIVKLYYNHDEIKCEVWSPYGRTKSAVTLMVGFHIIKGDEAIHSQRTKVLLKLFMFNI